MKIVHFEMKGTVSLDDETLAHTDDIDKTVESILRDTPYDSTVLDITEIKTRH